MSAKIKNQIGTIQISAGVFSSIVESALADVNSVEGASSKKISDGAISIFGIDIVKKGTKVYFNEEKVDIDVFITIQYGIKISDVAEKIMKIVKTQVEKITGVKVEKVNVIVQGIKVE
jgi:uncharacterized alkaline shock family protein YloU